jgi:Barstar (barnase inhibitor)
MIMTTNIPENATSAGWEQDQSIDRSHESTQNHSGNYSGMNMSSTPTTTYYSNQLYSTGNILRDLSAIPPKKPAPSWRAALAVRDGGPAAMLRSVRTNIVQSIRAFRTEELMEAASELGQHFVYANSAHAYTKSEVLDSIAKAYHFTKQQAKNYDPLLDALTTLIDKSGPQPGFVVVLEGLPSTLKFDKDARETLLDVFRDAVEYWAERRVPYRVFYSFAN